MNLKFVITAGEKRTPLETELHNTKPSIGAGFCFGIEQKLWETILSASGNPCGRAGAPNTRNYLLPA